MANAAKVVAILFVSVQVACAIARHNADRGTFLTIVQAPGEMTVSGV